MLYHLQAHGGSMCLNALWNPCRTPSTHTLARSASHSEENIKEKAGRIFVVTPAVVRFHHYECRRVSTKQQRMEKKNNGISTKRLGFTALDVAQLL